MALSANMAGAGAGNAMAMTPGGMGFGANAMAAPQAFSSFEPPPTAGPGPSNAGGPGGAGGAYDLRAWEKKDEPDEDMHACLGVDVGTSNIKACLYLRDGGCKAIGGNVPLPASILVDPKTGVKGVRRWLKSRAAGASASSAPPKGVKLFHSGKTEDKGAVVWPLRLLALGLKGAETIQRVQSSLRHEIKVSSDGSQEADDADTSGVRLLLSSPKSSDTKDKEVWCTPEEILAMLLAGVKVKAEEAHSVTVKTCSLSAPSSLGDVQRVALQRSVFLAGMVPGRFVGAPLAAAVGFMWGRSTADMKKSDDLILSVGMGASFFEVAVISPGRDDKTDDPSTGTPSGDDVAPKNTPPGSTESVATGASGSSKKKKKKGKGGGGGRSGGRDETPAEVVEYCVKASAGDSTCGGLDMDYLVARALLAAVEDSSGSEVASDRTLWRNLLNSAQVLRESLSSEAKSTRALEAGCCDVDPTFKHSLELSQSEMEAAVAGTMETVRNTLQAALDRAGATAGGIKTVVLHGLGVKTPAVVDEVLKMCVNAQIEHASPGDCAKGASLLLAGSRGLLSALPVKGHDAVPHKLGLLDRSKKGAEVAELFAANTSIPAFSTQHFSRTKTGSGLAVDMEVVQWVDEDRADGVSGKKGGKKGAGGRWVTVQRLGNPLALQDDSGYPVLAEEVETLFSLDDCGICVNEVQSSTLPKKKPGPSTMRRLANQAMVALGVLGVLGGGYWMLHRLEHAGERRQASARIRLTEFYEKFNPDKLDTVEEALARYKGREDVLFQRLKKQYGQAN